MILALKSRPDLWRLIKFLLVGVLNTGFGFAIYAILLKLVGFGPQLSLILSYVAGVIWNYFTHARLVFDAKGYGRLPAYAFAYSVLYGLNALALAVVTSFGWPPLAAQAVLVLPMALLAFMVVSPVLTGRLPFLPALKGVRHD
jgi:putative flippase GtrA